MSGPGENVVLYPHQERALSKMHDGCVLVGGVGTGKTITALAYYWQHHRENTLYIFTTARKRDELDWQNDAIKFGLGEEPLLKSDGSVFAGKIVVDSWNNIHKYTDIRDGFVIADEQRLVGSGKWAKSFLKIAKNNPWILLSATPGDTWLDYATIFIANGFYKNLTDFKRQHVVYTMYAKFPKVERYIGVGRLLRNREKVLVEMPYSRHTKRHLIKRTMSFDVEKYEKVVKKRWNVYEDQPIQNVVELISLMRRVVNSDESRVEFIRTLLEEKKRLIVFYSFDYELEALRALQDCVTVAEWNGHKHEQVPDEESWVYLVQYTAGAEAWNCVLTDSIVFYSLQYSYKVFEQAQGRIDRLNTPFKDLYYYILASNASIDKMLWTALRNKKNFNERKLRMALEKERF